MNISTFNKKYITLPDRVFMCLVAITFVLSAILFSINHFKYHYTTILLFAPHINAMSWLEAIIVIAFGFVFLFYGMVIRDELPRASNFIWGMGLFFWALASNVTLTNALQATPFPPIDQLLVHADQWMGINTPKIMAWTHDHPHFHFIFNHAYAGLVWELLLLPVSLALFNSRKSLCVFFIAQCSAFIIGALIYYFFPTMAPSGVFHSPYFSIAQHDTSLRFYDVHHFLKLTTAQGGLIAFPSFHVVWAILISYGWFNKKFIFYPLAVFNVLVIAATVFLGWHYLVDVIGGVVLAVVGIVFAEKIWVGVGESEVQ